MAETENEENNRGSNKKTWNVLLEAKYLSKLLFLLDLFNFMVLFISSSLSKYPTFPVSGKFYDL